MTQIAVLTPDPADPSYAGQWPGVLERLAACLAQEGLQAVASPWIDHVETAEGLRAYPLVLPLICWGYHRNHDRWMQACATWAEAGLPVANPAAVLAWNSDKAYLRRLADAGVAIPPTIWTDRAADEQVQAAFDAFGTDTLIVKPTVSGGAWKTLRLSRGEALADAPEGAAMIQPYLATIETEGETSMLFFGGRFSHAVNKRPVPGEFRIQVQFGGRYSTVTPPDGTMALAQQVLSAIDEPLLYARIDTTRDAAGNWLLMEAELIEPDFYLANDPAMGTRFAQAVKKRL